MEINLIDIGLDIPCPYCEDVQYHNLAVPLIAEWTNDDNAVGKPIFIECQTCQKEFRFELSIDASVHTNEI